MGMRFLGSKSARLKAMAATTILASSLAINGITPQYAHSAEVDESARYEEILEEAQKGRSTEEVFITNVKGQDLQEVTYKDFKNMYLHDVRPSKETLKLMLNEDYGVSGYTNPSMNSRETDPYQILLAEKLRENNMINSNKSENSLEIKNKISEIYKNTKELNTRRAIAVLKRDSEVGAYTQEELKDMLNIKNSLNSVGDKFQQQEAVENLLNTEWEKLLEPSFISLTSTQDILRCKNLKEYLEENLYEKDMNSDQLAKFAVDYKKTIRANIETFKEKQKLRDNSVTYREVLRGVSDTTNQIDVISKNFSGTNEEKSKIINDLNLKRAIGRIELEYLDKKLGVEAVELSYVKDTTLVDKYESEISKKTMDLELKKKLNEITENSKTESLNSKELGEER